MSEQKEFSRENSSSSQDYEHDLTIDHILADDNCKLDRSLGKRLCHLNSITLTPRINGKIPDISNATLDHERLSERLTAYGLAELQVEGDGNCQFRALADQLFRSPDYHRHVRKEVVKQLQHFEELYEGYVPMHYKTYLKDMKRSGEWGDHVTLQAAADRIAIHYYGRLAAKQGWRFDSTYEHKDESGDPVPFVFTVGSGKVISGIEAAVKTMKLGGVRRVIIPPSQGYQNMSQEPIPPDFFDRQRLFTTIFNPTRLANGEGSTLGTLVFDIELVSLRHL